MKKITKETPTKTTKVKAPNKTPKKTNKPREPKPLTVKRLISMLQKMPPNYTVDSVYPCTECNELHWSEVIDLVAFDQMKSVDLVNLDTAMFDHERNEDIENVEPVIVESHECPVCIEQAKTTQPQKLN